jgi:hypothetical protein
MGPTPPPALRPVTAEFTNTLQRAETQSAPIQSAFRFSRAADGKTRVDSGNISAIFNPATAQTVVLDHDKKTATIQPGPPPAPPAGLPAMPHFALPALPGEPKAASVQVENLGKSVVQGHEVEGKRFVTPPWSVPKAPVFQMPGVPKPPVLQTPGVPKPPALQTPGVPKPPQMPGAPAVPQIPQPPITTEVWHSTTLGVPMVMKMSGGFGQLTQVCKSAVPGEPHPSAFQIPQDYKLIGAQAPSNSRP